MVQMKAATIQCATYYESKISDNNRTKVRRGGEVPIARLQYQRQVLRCHVGLLGPIAAIHPLPQVIPSSEGSIYLCPVCGLILKLMSLLRKQEDSSNSAHMWD